MLIIYKRMDKNNKDNKDEFEDLGAVELNQNGRPKQAVILYELTPEMIEQAKQKIQRDMIYLPQKKYEEAKQKSAKVWDNFYSNHKCNFFKDRNYLQREIKEIAFFRQKHEKDKQIYKYMELGCGVGNTLFPLLREYNFFTFYGCDISAQAIQLIQKEMQNHPEYKQRLKVEVCDLVKNQLPFNDQKPDLLSMIFVLSAIVPEKHQEVITKIAKWMKPGSCFFFRDYGRYDFGQVNMSNKGNRKLKDNFYVKHDGVCVYYFQQSEMEELFVKAGLVKVQSSIHCRLLQNRKTGLKMYRIWVQGRYYKAPIDPFFQEKINFEKQNTKKEKQTKQEKQSVQENQKHLNDDAQKPLQLNEQKGEINKKQDQINKNVKSVQNQQKQLKKQENSQQKVEQAKQQQNQQKQDHKENGQ